MTIIPWCFGKWLKEWYWCSFSVASILLLLIQVIVASIIHSRQKMMQNFTLIPTLPDDVSTHISVDFEEDSLVKTLGYLHTFIDICELDELTARRIELCCEELITNIFEFSSDKAQGHSFDVCITEKETYMEIQLKDAGKPFNPIIKFEKYKNSTNLQKDIAPLGLLLVNKTCLDISYNYRFGLNVTLLKFSKENTSTC